MTSSSATELGDFDEAALVVALRDGDSAAFAQLVQQYGPRMLATARRIMGHDHDAQDALQDALLSAVRGIGKFDSQSQLGTWLHRIVVNASLMKLRTRRRHPEISGDETIQDLLPQFAPDGHHARAPGRWPEVDTDAAQTAETRAIVRAAIEELPENYRTVLLLRDIEEMSTEETARLLGVNEGVIKTRLHRARQALRTLLDRQFRNDSL